MLANTYFVERLRHCLNKHLGSRIDRIQTLADVGIDAATWEEAMYAMFGYLCVNDLYNFQPNCTGAARPVVGGKIAPGDNYRALLAKLQG